MKTRDGAGGEGSDANSGKRGPADLEEERGKKVAV